MNPETFSKPTRRFLALVLPLIVLYAAAMWIVVPVLSAEAERALEVRQARITLAKYRGAAAARTDLEAALAEARSRGPSKTVTASAPSLAVASARLQSDVRTAIANRAGRATSLESLAPEDESAVTRVGVRVQGSLPAEEFPRLLHELEAGAGGLLVGDLTAASRSAQIGRSQSAGGGRDELIFMLMVYRYYQIGKNGA